MSNFFSSKQVYGPKWSLVDSRNFTEEEKNMISSTKVVPSEYGLSMCFMLKSGGAVYTPLSKNSSYKVGDTPNMDQLKVLTLEREGETIEKIE